MGHEYLPSHLVVSSELPSCFSRSTPQPPQIDTEFGIAPGRHTDLSHDDISLSIWTNICFGFDSNLTSSLLSRLAATWWFEETALLAFNELPGVVLTCVDWASSLLDDLPSTGDSSSNCLHWSCVLIDSWRYVSTLWSSSMCCDFYTLGHTPVDDWEIGNEKSGHLITVCCRPVEELQRCWMMQLIFSNGQNFLLSPVWKLWWFHAQRTPSTLQLYLEGFLL